MVSTRPETSRLTLAGRPEVFQHVPPVTPSVMKALAEVMEAANMGSLKTTVILVLVGTLVALTVPDKPADGVMKVGTGIPGVDWTVNPLLTVKASGAAGVLMITSLAPSAAP